MTDANNDDDDYTQLPLADRLVHKQWKARQHAYDQLNAAVIDNNDIETIAGITDNSETLRKIASDANVISQESGLKFIVTFLESFNPQKCAATRESVVPVLVEKGLTSSRPNARAHSLSALLIYVQKDDPSKVIELLIPTLAAKSPKQVVATIKAVNEIYNAFGCPSVSPKCIIDAVPRMFAHSDKNVRAEATKLAVTLRSYIGDAFDTLVFPKLKPIQQKDLTALFTKIGEPPTATRLLYAEEQRRLVEQQNKNDDVEMPDVTFQPQQEVKIDPYDLETPVDVLSKLPSNLSERVSDSIWKERVEVLEEISKFFKVVRIENDDFSYFVSLMVGCLKDVNLQVVTLACGILTDLANGLKTGFAKYTPSLLSPLLDRTKEKKKPVLDALNSVLDLSFKYGSFNDIVDPVVEHMTHISPPVKIESMQYLIRCLKQLPNPLNSTQEEKIMGTAIKLLQDSQLGVRSAASDVLGTMLKIMGSGNGKKYLEKIDKRHIKKVEQIRDAAVVACVSVSPTTTQQKPQVQQHQQQPQQQQAPRRIEESRGPVAVNHTLNPPAMVRSSIPSKRMATSPIKENTPNHKTALTSKSLRASGSNFTLSNAQLQELESLQAEKQEWNEMRRALTSQLEELKSNNADLMKDVVALNNKLDDYHDKFTTMNMTLKSKDTQLFRLRSDLESSTARNAQLQQRTRFLETQLENQHQKQPEQSYDIDRRISNLSIDSNNADNEKPALNLAKSTLFNMDDNDDDWKRATVVTNELKAKIQRMKARTRVLEPTDDLL